MEKRPKINLELAGADKALEIVGALSVFAIWGLTIINYNSLPDIIPKHYNIAGEADSFGGKESILILPVISTVIFAGLTILNKFPHIFNYQTVITKENALRQYTNAARLIRYLKFIVVVIFGFIEFKTIQIANGQANGLGTWFLLFTAGVVFIPLIYFSVKMVRTIQ